MKCPVCNCEWSEEASSLPPAGKSCSQAMRKVSAPCGHGHACLVRYYDTASYDWYYEQIDFVRED